MPHADIRIELRQGDACIHPRTLTGRVWTRDNVPAEEFFQDGPLVTRSQSQAICDQAIESGLTVELS